MGGVSFASLNELSRGLPPAAKVALLEHFGELSALTTFRVSTLVVTSGGWVAGSRATYSMAHVIVNGGNRAAVVRQRAW